MENKPQEQEENIDFAKLWQITKSRKLRNVRGQTDRGNAQ